MEITAEMVRTLREKSGAGIMECKQALKETNGDVEEAVVYLRKRGLAKAGKKEGRATSEGAIGSYIHAGSKIGTMVELNCETDFVANTPDFKELLRDIAMHIAAAKPRFVSRDEVTPEIMAQEREIFAHQARESGKPEKVVEKIVEGKMEKFYEENCLLDQYFVKENTVTIQELVKQKIAKLGENITVGRFARFEISK
ncbi:MAG: translation elongation factor Ts [Nitrospinae bacterium]|nr:translation elongation factor Ts [Nitrospinota bacterium]